MMIVLKLVCYALIDFILSGLCELLNDSISLKRFQE